MDEKFNETDFLGKVSNTYIMILTAIMTDNIKRVEHKISPNVKEQLIKDKCEKEDHYEITVLLTSRYMDYQVDKTTGEYVSGINTERVEKEHYLTFSKIKGAKEIGIIKECPNCGASIDSNNTGICPYCRSVYNLKDYDWILIKMN